MSTHFKYTLITLLLAFFAFSLGLYLAGIGAFSPFGTTVVTEKTNGVIQTVVQKGSYEKGYNEALDFARQKLVDEGIIDETVDRLYATVKSINGQNIIVEFGASDLDLLQEGMATRTITVAGDTVIEQHIIKPEGQFQKEYDEYEKVRQEYEDHYAQNPDDPGMQEPDEPLEYTIKILQLSDLKAGYRINILTEMNIRTNDAFEATNIYSEYSPEPEIAVEPEDEVPGDVVTP